MDLEIRVADSIGLSDDDIDRLRTSTEDHFVERKSYGDWHKDIAKTVVAFANSLPIDKPGYIFIGVRDNGDVEASRQDLDTVQKTLADRLKLIYPRVYYVPKVMRCGDSEYLVVIVYGSKDRPHFAGPSYIREGSQTKEASESQYGILIAERQSKVYELRKWIGKQITVEWLLRIAHGMSRSVVPQATLVDCTQFYVVFAKGDTRTAIPLYQVNISIDPKWGDRLKLEVDSN